MLLAKSADIGGHAETLLEHSHKVALMARTLFGRLTAAARSYSDLELELEAAAAVHDIGKAANGFQAMLLGERRNWNGWRHETLSAAFASQIGLSEEVVLAVLTHHRDIPGQVPAEGGGRLHWLNGAPEDWPSILAEWSESEALARQVWRELCEGLERHDLLGQEAVRDFSIALDAAWLDCKLTRRQAKTLAPERRMRASLLRGLLVSADHLASGGVESLPELIDLKTFSPSFETRDFQRRCSVVDHVILRAPTGSGKTEAALIWAAANQPDNGRLFYTLPYTAALNAMHARLEKEFPAQRNSIGLLHGRASQHLYEAAQNDFPADKQRATAEALARARLAREMYHPVRVCTPHQLLRFTLRGKGWEQMLAEIPGSCVVFDEVHSYDPALAGLTLGTARLFANMGARLMFASATLPRFLEEIISNLVHCTRVSPDPRSESDREIIDRKRHVVQVVACTLVDLLPRIEQSVRDGLRVLVVCNHVRSSQIIASSLRRSIGDEKVCLFHGRFNMRDRRAKETALSSGSLPTVLVATQVVEVSLDISYDTGFLEAAPIDALVQRMGRVNRKGNTPVPITIARPINGHRLYSSGRTETTLNLLRAFTGPLSEQDLVQICDTVYEHGYDADERQRFEERLNHRFLSRFSEELIAGQHQNWIEDVINRSDGRVDVLPESLKHEYQNLVKEKRWLDADALLVSNVYYPSIAKFIDDKTSDPWIVNLRYGRDGLEFTR